MNQYEAERLAEQAAETSSIADSENSPVITTQTSTAAIIEPKRLSVDGIPASAGKYAQLYSKEQK